MIGWTNMADGGVNIQNGKAIIHVLAQVGSTINFLKDGITIILKPDKSFVDIADDKLAHWYYSINSSNYGTWTVTATLGTDTISDTVLIASNEEYSVNISFYYLFNADGAYKGEWSAKAWSNTSATKYSPGLTIDTNLNIELSTGSTGVTGTVLNSSPLLLSKDTIFYTWNSCSVTGSSAIRPIVLTPYADSYTIVAQGNLITTNTGTDSIDISALSSGDYYFGFKIYAGNGKATVSISEVDVT